MFKMVKQIFLAMLVGSAVFCAGCGTVPPAQPAAVAKPETASSSPETPTPPAAQQPETSYLPPPLFLETAPEVCLVAQNYITLSDEEFSALYSAEQLWQLGVFDRLLFTSAAQYPIVGGIAIGDSLEKVEGRFGKSQFTKTEESPEDAPDYLRYTLYGYQTKAFYFAFQIDHETQTVQSVCIRKRYPLPDDLKDILVKLSQYTPWYGNTSAEDADSDAYFRNGRSSYAQWGRGSMTMICDYGFTSTSGSYGDTYSIFADFEGSIPKLPFLPGYDEDDSDFDPIRLLNVDYPEQMIYNIYDYIAEGNRAIAENTGVYSPNGTIFADARSWDSLNMAGISHLYENSHMVFHWIDGSKPDKLVYFGHFTTAKCFLSERYFAESNMLGFHVYDLEKDVLVYDDQDFEEDGLGLNVDFENHLIRNKEGDTCYQYSYSENGDLRVEKAVPSASDEQ